MSQIGLENDIECQFDYRKVLVRELELRSIRNSFYGLRAFARDLQMSASTLSEVLNQKKGISLEKARSVADKLQLHGGDLELFVLSVESQHARAKARRQYAQSKMAELIDDTSEPPKTQTISDWVTEAVWKLHHQSGRSKTIASIATRLSVPQFMVTSAKRYLVRMGFVKGPGKRAFLAHKGKNRRIQVDREQIIEQSRKAFLIGKCFFEHRPLLLADEDLAAAEGHIRRALKKISQLEKNQADAKLYYVSTQLFTPEQFTGTRSTKC